MNTDLAKIGSLPDCKADVSGLSPAFQETVKMFCGAKEGGPGRVEILVNDITEFIERDVSYKDGTTFILHLVDLKLLLVTYYESGRILYATYNEDGTFVKAKKKTGLNPRDCKRCHTFYDNVCSFGQCGTHGKFK